MEKTKHGPVSASVILTRVTIPIVGASIHPPSVRFLIE
jgi:hypothetical protein